MLIGVLFQRYVDYMSSNIVFNLLFGKTFDYDYPKYLEFYYYLQRVFDFQNPRALHYWLLLCIVKRMSVPKQVISMRKNFIEKLQAEFFRQKPPSVEAARNREVSFSPGIRLPADPKGPTLNYFEIFIFG